MKPSDKRKLLQEALQGKTEPLRQLQRERLAKAMPYLEVHGLLDIRHIDPLLLDIAVIDGEDLLEDNRVCKPLGEWLQTATSTGKAYATVDAQNDHYDTVPLAYIQLQIRDYRNYTLPGGTIADLRRYFGQCSTSFKEPFIILMFDSDLSRYQRKAAYETSR